MDERIAANRDNWDDRVPIHVASAFYDVEGWLASPPGVRPRERASVGDVTGLDAVHLQCHIGLDTLALLVDGAASVTGLDVSPAAVAQARVLADRAGFGDRARFVEADVLDAATALAPATFDLVYVSLGALCWLPSVTRWAAQVAALLRPGGRLHLHDVHPLAWASADDDLRLEHTWFEEAEPFVDDADVTYTDGDGRIASTRSYEWNHGIGEVVTAVLEQGLRLDRLVEHDWTAYPRFPFLVDGGDGTWHLPPDRARSPLSFTLGATRPG